MFDCLIVFERLVDHISLILLVKCCRFRPLLRRITLENGGILIVPYML